MYKYDIYQVYRSLKDYDCYGNIIPKDMLLQIARIERSTSIALKPEDGGTYYWIQAKDLLNEDNFKRVF